MKDTPLLWLSCALCTEAACVGWNRPRLGGAALDMGGGHGGEYDRFGAPGEEGPNESIRPASMQPLSLKEIATGTPGHDSDTLPPSHTKSADDHHSPHARLPHSSFYNSHHHPPPRPEPIISKVDEISAHPTRSGNTHRPPKSDHVSVAKPPRDSESPKSQATVNADAAGRAAPISYEPPRRRPKTRSDQSKDSQHSKGSPGLREPGYDEDAHEREETSGSGSMHKPLPPPLGVAPGVPPQRQALDDPRWLREGRGRFYQDLNSLLPNPTARGEVDSSPYNLVHPPLPPKARDADDEEDTSSSRLEAMPVSSASTSLRSRGGIPALSVVVLGISVWSLICGR